MAKTNDQKPVVQEEQELIRQGGHVLIDGVWVPESDLQ